MSFSLYYRKLTRELFIFYKAGNCDSLCAISLDGQLSSKQKVIGDKDWKNVDPEFQNFSFDKAYVYFRNRATSLNSHCYRYYRNVINCFFQQSLLQAEYPLLDRYNAHLFLLLLFIRRSFIHKLVENNSALALLLVYTKVDQSLQNRPVEFWSQMGEMAQLAPSRIIKKKYHLKSSRKAANILQKIDTKELPDINPLLTLTECLRDDWITRILDKLIKITYEVLVIVLDQQNRSFINAGFLLSLDTWPENKASASFMLQWFHTNHIAISFPLRNVCQLDAIYEYMKKQMSLSSVKKGTCEVPSYFAWADSESINDWGGKRNDPLRVPHRLESGVDIALAMQHDVLGLGAKTYQRMLHMRRRMLIIKKPAALLKARSVSRDFYVLKKKRITEQHESYRHSEGLSSITGCDLIEDQISGFEEVIEPEFLTTCAESSDEERDNKKHNGRVYTLKLHQELKTIISRELRSLMHCNNTRSMTRHDLKRLICALTLHDNRNKDVLQAVKMAKAMGDNILWGNALAELLFARLPRYVKSLFVDDPQITLKMRQKLLSRISRLSTPANLKIALYHMAPRTNTRKKKDFIMMTQKMCSFIEKVNVIDEELKTSFICFIQNMIGQIRRLESLYQKLFLPSKELETLFSLYVPNNKLVTCSLTSTERIIQEHCRKQALYMYPSKDYLDLEKYRWSRDCTRDSLGVNHLATPCFFNIRLFSDNKDYCGNIYMLQLEYDSKWYLLVDRIQTSKFSTKYAMFFQILRDAFVEMFEGFPFYEILLPNDQISNNKSLNKIFFKTKSEFPKKKIRFELSNGMRSHFDSVRGDTFRVLCNKTAHWNRVCYE